MLRNIADIDHFGRIVIYSMSVSKLRLTVRLFSKHYKCRYALAVRTARTVYVHVRPCVRVVQCVPALTQAVYQWLVIIVG